MRNRTLGLTLSLLASVAATAYSRQSKLVSSATQVVSPVAVATWVTVPGGQLLDLLVLWRGSPGWFSQNGQHGSAGGSPGRFYSTQSYGSVSLDIDFDTVSRVVSVNGMTVKLGTDNVVLVDHVDSAKDIAVVGTLSLNEEMPPRQIAAVIRHSDRAVQFLRCDVKLESPGAQSVMERLCKDLTGK